MALRVTVFIDGFNLYYGLLKPNPGLRWLDLAALAAALRPDARTTVRYFTAKVRPVPDPSTEARQRIYLRALETKAGVAIHYGRFATNQARVALVTPPPVTVLAWKTEEKGSDVNLGTWLILDGLDGRYDEAIVISGDSDLKEPILQANRRFGPVHVVNPRDVHSDLASVAASYRALDPAVLKACQLPDSITLPSGRTVTRPPRWR